MLACAYPGMQRTGDAVTSILPAGIRLGHESAPWFVRSRAGLRAIRHQADEGYCPCPRWCCAAFRWASEGRYRPYPPIDQRVYHRRRWWLSHAMMLCCRLKRCTDSAPAPPGASGAFQSLSVLGSECGFRWTLQEPHSPQIFRSTLTAFPARSSLIPIGGALCRLCALYGGVGRIVTAWQRHGRSGGTGRLSA